jgi:hypothetical protein
MQKDLDPRELELNHVINEDQLMEMLGCSKKTLDGLRLNRGLPLCSLNQQIRVYLVPDILAWIHSKRTQFSEEDSRPPKETSDAV